MLTNTQICDNVVKKKKKPFVYWFFSSFNICAILLNSFHTTNRLITGLVIGILSLFSCLSHTLTSLEPVFVHLSFRHQTLQKYPISI